MYERVDMVDRTTMDAFREVAMPLAEELYERGDISEAVTLVRAAFGLSLIDALKRMRMRFSSSLHYDLDMRIWTIENPRIDVVVYASPTAGHARFLAKPGIRVEVREAVE